MAQRKKIASDINKSVDDTDAAIDRLVSKFPKSQQQQALEDCYKARDYALSNRLQSKL